MVFGWAWKLVLLTDCSINWIHVVILFWYWGFLHFFFSWHRIAFKKIKTISEIYIIRWTSFLRNVNNLQLNNTFVIPFKYFHFVQKIYRISYHPRLKIPMWQHQMHPQNWIYFAEYWMPYGIVSRNMVAQKSPIGF